MGMIDCSKLQCGIISNLIQIYFCFLDTCLQVSLFNAIILIRLRANQSNQNTICFVFPQTLIKTMLMSARIYFLVFAGQEEWGGQCRSGRRQSPIDLAKDAAIMGRYPSLLFRSYDSVLKNAKIRNTGHSCKLNSSLIQSVSLHSIVLFFNWPKL